MLEGLFISLVGMTAVFVTLTIIMFLMIGIERVFPSKEEAVEKMVAVGERVVAERKGEEPEDMAEVAAVALAVALHRKGRKQQAQELSRSPVATVANDGSYRGTVHTRGLPLAEQIDTKIKVRVSHIQRERAWRSAYSLLQGGYWCRRGWTGRGITDTNRF